jgi:hypothetical protein
MPPPHHVSVRLDPEILARVDALAPAFSTEWHAATRSDIVRALILDALPRFEKGGPAQPSGPEGKPRRARR